MRIDNKKLTDWARQMLPQLRRWLPRSTLVVVADSSFTVISLLERMQRLAQPICMIVRFRRDAALYGPASPSAPASNGTTAREGQRLPTLKQVADNPKTR